MGLVKRLPRGTTVSYGRTHTLARASVRGRAVLDPARVRNIQECRSDPLSEREGAGAFMVWANTAWSTLGAGLVN